MGNTDSVPVLSQAKSLAQIIGGDMEGARNTQRNFSRGCIVVSQIRSIVEGVSGNREAAFKTQLYFLQNIETLIDSTPIVGHIKGTIHYVTGNSERGGEILKSATRTTGIMASGAGGFIVGGPVGAAAVGAVVGPTMDNIITCLDSLMNKEYRPYGYFALRSKFNSRDEKITPGDLFDAVIAMPIGDALVGAAGGQLAKTYIYKSVLSKTTPTVPDVIIRDNTPIRVRIGRNIRGGTPPTKKLVYMGVETLIQQMLEKNLQPQLEMTVSVLRDQHNDDELDFNGTFEGWINNEDEILFSTVEPVGYGTVTVEWSTCGQPEAQIWPRQYLARCLTSNESIPLSTHIWRLLASSDFSEIQNIMHDDGDGSQQILSRANSYHCPSSFNPRDDALRHVAHNPDYTEYISTSTDFAHLYNQLVKIAQETTDNRRRYLVQIDTRRLLRTSTIINLTLDENREKYLVNDNENIQSFARSFAKRWSLVLVKNAIPAEAICRVWKAVDGKIICDIVHDYKE